MVMGLVKKVFGSQNDRQLKRMSKIVDNINSLEGHYEALSESELLDVTTVLRDRLAKGESLDDVLPDAFAAVRESSKRTLGMRHFDVQLIGGISLSMKETLPRCAPVKVKR